MAARAELAAPSSPRFASGGRMVNWRPSTRAQKREQRGEIDNQTGKSTGAQAQCARGGPPSRWNGPGERGLSEDNREQQSDRSV